MISAWPGRCLATTGLDEAKSSLAADETQHWALVSLAQQVTYLRGADLQRLSEHGYRCTMVTGELRGLPQQRRHLARIGCGRVGFSVVNSRQALVGPARRRLGGTATLHHPADQGRRRHAPRSAKPVQRRQVEPLRQRCVHGRSRGQERGGELVGLLLDGRAVLTGVDVQEQVADLVGDREPVSEHVLRSGAGW